MDVPSYLLGKKSSGGGGGGTTYTAGTNIEITSENVINNTIPYYANTDNDKRSMSIGVDGTRNANSTSFGLDTVINGVNATAIGNKASSSASGVALGMNAKAAFFHSIAIGRNATTTKGGQAVFGSINSPITELAIYNGGLKPMATQEYVDTAIATAITSALGGSY